MPTPSTILTTDKLPSGIDWADGLSGRLGTASSSGAVRANGGAGSISTVATIPVEELPDSPTIERAEQATVTHSYVLPYAEALSKVSIYGRGTLTKDSVDNYYRVLSSTVTRMKGNMARLQIVSEALTYDNTPDEFHIVPVELGVDILKHPRYFYAIMPTDQIPGFTGTPDTQSQAAFKQQLIRALQTYRENPAVPNEGVLNLEGKYQEEITMFLKALKTMVKTENPNFNEKWGADDPPIPGTTFASNSSLPYPLKATDALDLNPQYYYTGFDFSISANDPYGKVILAAAAALEIMQKIWRMEDTPYVVGWQITWSEYSFRPPFLNPGGYIEDPKTANPSLPDYFGSTSYPPAPDLIKSIFYKMDSFNPQCYSANGQYGGGTSISWLRKADEMEYQRTWFKVTRTWIGAPLGTWDSDLYGKKQRPVYSTDYTPMKFITPAA